MIDVYHHKAWLVDDYDQFVGTWPILGYNIMLDELFHVLPWGFDHDSHGKGTSKHGDIVQKFSGWWMIWIAGVLYTVFYPKKFLGIINRNPWHEESHKQATITFGICGRVLTLLPAGGLNSGTLFCKHRRQFPSDGWPTKNGLWWIFQCQVWLPSGKLT